MSRHLAPALKLLGADQPPVATCPADGAPLVATIAFPGAEFYCLDCGRTLGFLSPTQSQPTPELVARLEAVETEWAEHVVGRLLIPKSWKRDCRRCEGRREYHEQHATEGEREADRLARAWIAERVKR